MYRAIIKTGSNPVEYCAFGGVGPGGLGTPLPGWEEVVVKSDKPPKEWIKVRWPFINPVKKLEEVFATKFLGKKDKLVKGNFRNVFVAAKIIEDIMQREWLNNADKFGIIIDTIDSLNLPADFDQDKNDIKLLAKQLLGV